MQSLFSISCECVENKNEKRKKKPGDDVEVYKRENENVQNGLRQICASLHKHNRQVDICRKYQGTTKKWGKIRSEVFSNGLRVGVSQPSSNNAKEQPNIKKLMRKRSRKSVCKLNFMADLKQKFIFNRYHPPKCEISLATFDKLHHGRKKWRNLCTISQMPESQSSLS